MERKLCLTVLSTCALLAANVHGAGIIVPDGFEVEKLLTPLPSGFVHQIEAGRGAAFAKGVIHAIAGSRGDFKINRVSDTGSSTLTTIGPFPNGAEILTIRFDWTGLFQGQLLVSVFHNGGDQPFNYRTDIVMIDENGTFATRASFGAKTSPMAMHFDVTKGAGGFPPGMVLVDADRAGGTAVYHLDRNFTATLLGADVLPSGRTDFDPRGMEFAPTDTYDQFLTIAESSHADGISAVYQMKAGPAIVPLTALAAISLFEFRDMAFSPGNVMGDVLYVSDSVGKNVMTVSSSGRYKTFATGFNSVQSISIGDGASMFVSDADGIYRIFETPPPPPTEVEFAGVAVSAGAGTDSATGSRINLGQTSIGSMSNGTVIVHAGLIPRIKGAVLAPMFGDFSGNRTVDLGDYPQMNVCLRGPGVYAGEACALGDSDNDSDVDLRDAGAYANAFGDAAR